MQDPPEQIRVPPEHMECLIEELALVAPIHKAGGQGPVEILAPLKPGQRQRVQCVEHLVGAHVHARVTQDSGEVQNIFGQPPSARTWDDDGSHCTQRRPLGQVGLDLRQDGRRLAALHPGDVVLIFEQHPERVVDGLGVETDPVQLHQRPRPVDGLRHTGQLKEVHAPQPLDESDDLLG